MVQNAAWDNIHHHGGGRSDVMKLVPRGLGPRTLRLLAVRSNQLSYETVGDTGLVPPFVRQGVASHFPSLVDARPEVS